MRVGIILLLVIAACIYLTYPLIRAVRISKGVQEESIAYEQQPTDATMRILVVGDSTGVGTGSATPQGSVAGRIGALFPQASIENRSVNGARLKDVQLQLTQDTNEHYDILAIQVGANDITHFTSLASLQSELASVLTYAEAHASSTILLTAGNVGAAPVFKYPLSALMTHRTLQVRSIFMKVSQQYNSVTYVDLYEDSSTDPFITEGTKLYARDHFHPNEEGYEIWFQKVYPVLTNW